MRNDLYVPYLVITTPLWNFFMPAILKAWLDQVLISNVIIAISGNGGLGVASPSQGCGIGIIRWLL